MVLCLNKMKETIIGSPVKTKGVQNSFSRPGALFAAIPPSYFASDSQTIRATFTKQKSIIAFAHRDAAKMGNI